MTPTAPARSSVWKLTFAGAALIAACYGLARFAYGLFVPTFREAFDLGAATVGALASGSYASYCVAIIISTLLTPRFGGRAIAVAAGTTATLGTVTIALAPNTATLAAGVIVAGASTGIASPPLAHAIAHTVETARQSRVQTVVNAGTGLGVAISGPVALLAHEHWRAAWIAFAALSAAITIWAALTVPRRTRAPGATAGIHAAGAGLLPRPLLPPGALRLIGASLLLGTSSTAIWTFGRDLLVSEGRLSDTASTICWILLGALGVIGAAGGDLQRVLGLRRAWIVTVTVLATSTGLVAIAPSSIVASALALAVFGATYIAASGLLLLWGTRVYADHPAAGVGLAFLVLALGQTLAAPALGGISDLVGQRAAFIVAAAVGLVGALTCAPHSEQSRRSAASAGQRAACLTLDPRSPEHRA